MIPIRAISLLMAAGLAAVALLAPPSTARSHVDNRELCEHCGRYIDTSPSRLAVTLKIRRHDKRFKVCSVYCLCERLERITSEAELYRVSVLDYATAGDETPLMINAFKSHYLYDVEGDEQLAHEPFIVAFRTEKAAEEAQEELGGELLDWEAVFEACTELAEENDDGGRRREYTPLKKR